MDTFNVLKSDVELSNDPSRKMHTFLMGLSAQIKAANGDAAKLQAITNQLDSEDDRTAFATAFKANLPPAQPAPQPGQVGPVPNPAPSPAGAVTTGAPIPVGVNASEAATAPQGAPSPAPAGSSGPGSATTAAINAGGFNAPAKGK